MLCMIFAFCAAYAQTDSNVLTSASDTLSIKVPLHGKSRFAQSHYIYQTAEISMLVGHDKNRDDNDANQGATDGDSFTAPDIISGLNKGMNIGYSLIFVPGTIKNDELELNRFGFAYSTGFVAAFDRQDDYDVTCDFLFKLGVETGNGHALGVGLDGLIGGGKSSGTMYDLNDETQTPNNYTMWCYKYGAQLWIKTNLLTTNVENSDILVFARFVDSKNPQNDNLLWENGIYNDWIEESWQFGVMFRYCF